MKEYKIAILGNKDSILGFKNLGLESFSLDQAEKPEEELKNVLDNKEYGLVFITEDWHKKYAEMLSDYKNRALPAIITIPSSKGSTGESMKEIKKIVEQAVGSDILSS